MLVSRQKCNWQGTRSNSKVDFVFRGALIQRAIEVAGIFTREDYNCKDSKSIKAISVELQSLFGLKNSICAKSKLEAFCVLSLIFTLRLSTASRNMEEGECSMEFKFSESMLTKCLLQQFHSKHSTALILWKNDSEVGQE